MTYSSMCLYMLLSSFVYLEQFRYYNLTTHKEYSFSSKVIHYMQENVERSLSLEQLLIILNILLLISPCFSKGDEDVANQLFYPSEDTESLSVYRTYQFKG